MKRLTCFALALGLAMSSPARADCKRFIRSWAQLYPQRTVDAAHVACIAWPANPKLTIAALPFDRQSADLGVVVADSATGKVVAHGLQEDAIDRSSWRSLERLAIDVAPYPLDKNRTAFGVVAVNRDTDSASRTVEAVMSMYVIDGPRVQQILDRLLVYWRTGGIFYDCAGEVSEVKRKLAVGASGSAGYPTLNASETSSTYASPHKGQSADDCNVRASDVKHRDYSIRYRNGRYEVPKALQPFA
ncbi:hypothetical protein [Burkholderia pseudomultivorans]|uniref:Multidrug ABC transporter ATPase n=1 Tax=Burkholderia pseudomultivorans TaxID=1207504 RepID=A0A132F2A6_9BURK|nr:hypothetical protein [Burkholderia pseudomultivorans]KVG68184.1 hypothetical protein WS80_02975 [Burkholderia pseudomultivorans]KWF67660.1 hypothetical protein WT57_16400 [Burkholderia pseudomultivorans]MBF5008456.1 hypothetical protein [Burkholderia pseudomultivorans]